MSKYMAKCGVIVTDEKSDKKYSYPILETDKAFLGSPKVDRPVWCDEKCLHKRRVKVIHQFDTKNRVLHTVKAYGCRFERGKSNE
ncbi:MAG: hypothetical protein ACYDG6_11395 [Thermincolia bacterium]